MVATMNNLQPPAFKAAGPRS